MKSLSSSAILMAVDNHPFLFLKSVANLGLKVLLKTVLKSLRLQNISLLNDQELNFQQGFTVITGETGAGKSILLDTLDVLLSNTQSASSTKLLQSGKTFFLIEGTFSITPPLVKWLEAEQLLFDNDELVVTREWRLREGKLKNRCRINGIFINKTQVIKLRNLLIDFTFQGSSYSLNSPLEQLNCLDRIGDDSFFNLLKDVQIAWKDWLKSIKLLEEAKNNYDKIQLNYHESKTILEELELANLDDPNEVQQLEIEEERLVNKLDLSTSVNKILSSFKDNPDNIPTVLDQVNLSLYELRQMVRSDQTVNNIYNELSLIDQSIITFIQNIEQYSFLLETEPQRLEHLQERLNRLKRLQKIHGLSLHELIDKRDQLRETLANDLINNNLSQLSKNESLARLKRDKINSIISLERKKLAKKFEIRLLDSLRPLGLSNVRFKVDINTIESNEKGKDLVKFLFSANPGQPMLSLHEIASGGEMSRFVLALKTILSPSDLPGILIFDEIDSGVSGRVSKAIANLLKILSLKTQVFCVTHQPLVAAAADNHYSVIKSIKDGKTSSMIKHLKGFSERKKELAELAGGELKEANLYAASLLEQQAA
tara:strand:+ start:20047 stop:21840 length:1794 start_codon:yes stop_codon:yes gene_type:complete